MRLNPSDRTLDVAVLRARGAVRCCGYRLALPPVVGGGLLGAGAGGGAGSKEGVAARDRWFFCCYLSNGVGIDLLPVTPEEVGVCVRLGRRWMALVLFCCCYCLGGLFRTYVPQCMSNRWTTRWRRSEARRSPLWVLGPDLEIRQHRGGGGVRETWASSFPLLHVLV